MFVPQGDLLSRNAPGAGLAERPPSIASIGFVTRNRGEALRRALVSYIENCRQFGREVDFAVMDDSEEASTREQHRELLRSLGRRYGVEILYAGLEEKQRYAEAMVRADRVPPEVIEFALFDVNRAGTAIGANRNALLLHTAGDLFFGADDDTVCQVATVPEATSDLAFFSESDPTEFWFFADRQQALRSVNFVEQDLLALHETMLGRDLASVARGVTKGRVQLDEVCPQLLHALRAGTGRILVTVNGLVGDSGMPSPVGLLSATRDATRARLLRSEADYRMALTSRQVLRLAPCASVYHGSLCMSTFLAFDNRTLLPPFLPVQRNEDGVFGLLLSQCFDDGYFGHLPWALVHAAEDRRYPSDCFQYISGRGLADIVGLSILSHLFRPGRVPPAKRLEVLGLHLFELGSLTLPDFEELIRLQLWQVCSHQIASLERILRIHQDEPRFWAADLRRYMDVLREALPRPDYIVPVDLRGGRTLTEARHLSQRLVKNLGQALQWWPHLVEVARSLRARGCRVATPVSADATAGRRSSRRGADG